MILSYYSFNLFKIIMMYYLKVPLKLYLRSVSSLKSTIIFMVIINFIFHGSWYVTITAIVKNSFSSYLSIVLTYTTSKSEINFGLEKVFSP